MIIAQRLVVRLEPAAREIIGVGIGEKTLHVTLMRSEKDRDAIVSAGNNQGVSPRLHSNKSIAAKAVTDNDVTWLPGRIDPLLQGGGELFRCIVEQDIHVDARHILREASRRAVPAIRGRR